MPAASIEKRLKARYQAQIDRQWPCRPDGNTLKKPPVAGAFIIELYGGDPGLLSTFTEVYKFLVDIQNTTFSTKSMNSIPSLKVDASGAMYAYQSFRSYGLVAGMIDPNTRYAFFHVFSDTPFELEVILTQARKRLGFTNFRSSWMDLYSNDDNATGAPAIPA